MTFLIVYLSLTCICSVMLKFSHLSLIIILSKISVFIPLEVPTFYISAEQIKLCL